MAFPLYNMRFVLLISASFITIFSSIAIYFCLPILISHVLRTQISLSPHSGSFNDWKLNFVNDRIYLYNISNMDEILPILANEQARSANNNNNNRVKIKLKQIGPIALKQTREKLNILFEPTNETVLYDQRKSWTFLSDLSIINNMQELKSMPIYHISIPLAGTTLNPEYAEFIDPIVSENDLKLFLNHSMNLLLFDGYPDILMEQAKSTGRIDIDRFGWMYNLNNSITKNIRVFTGPSNSTLDKFGSIDQFNHKQKFDIWHGSNSNNQCNNFRFSSAGEFFPPPKDSIISHYNYRSSYESPDKKAEVPDLIDSKINTQITSAGQSQLSHIDDRSGSSVKVGRTISLFMPDLCRVYKLTYSHSYNYKDALLVDRYIANDINHKYANQDSKSKEDPNRCYCVYNQNTNITSCPPNGMMDLFTCREGSPLTVSYPYFHHSQKDPSLVPYLNLFEYEDDTTPNQHEEHEFYLDLESTLNLPIKAQIVFQFNVHIRNETSLNFTKDYSFLFGSDANSKALADFYLPQMWIKSNAEVDESILENLKFIQKHISLVTPITTIIISAVAFILLTMSAKLAFVLTYGPKSRKSMSQDQESCSSLSRSNSQYLEEKQKYYAMQLLNYENSKATKNLGSNAGCSLNHDEPTTSNADAESQPLNR